jgi:YebC/PmpR family DNA-binding regulatory protein
MSGHSKWSTIKRKKGAIDARRGKLFTKLIKEISIAAKEGSPDPEANPRLRLAIANAKGNNMPKENIERAIKKAQGADADSYQEVSYEGYGPNGIAVFVECLTDNTNRTVSNVRSLFSKYGGSLGVSGSVEYLFDRKGVFSMEVPDKFDEDEFTLEMIDAGAEELSVEDGYIQITCSLSDFGNIQRKLDELKLEAENAQIELIPLNTVSLDDDVFLRVMRLIEALEDNDDVQRVFHNMDITEKQMEMVG